MVRPTRFLTLFAACGVVGIMLITRLSKSEPLGSRSSATLSLAVALWFLAATLGALFITIGASGAALLALLVPCVRAVVVTTAAIKNHRRIG